MSISLPFVWSWLNLRGLEAPSQILFVALFQLTSFSSISINFVSVSNALRLRFSSAVLFSFRTFRFTSLEFQVSLSLSLCFPFSNDQFDLRAAMSSGGGVRGAALGSSRFFQQYVIRKQPNFLSLSLCSFFFPFIFLLI